MQMRLGFALGLLLSIWLASSARADYVDSCVLLPDADGYVESMDPSTGSDDYACVDDSNDTVCELGDTTDYVYGITGTEMFGHTTAPDTSYNLDSMAMYIEVAEYKSGTEGSWSIIVGWRWEDSDVWNYCTYSHDDHHALDTISFSGLTCTSHRHSWTKDPCYPDERGLGWIYFGSIYDDHEAPGVQTFQWVADCISAEGGCIPNCLWRIYNWWWVGYFTVTEAEAGQVIIIGARDEEDFHNPRCGIPPAAWE